MLRKNARMFSPVQHCKKVLNFVLAKKYKYFKYLKLTYKDHQEGIDQKYSAKIFLENPFISL